MNAKDLLAELADFNEHVDELIGKHEDKQEPGVRAQAEMPHPPARPSIPPMISSLDVPQAEQEDDEELERYTADVREAAEAAIREVEAMTPRRLFEVLVNSIEDGFAEQMDLDRDFFKVRYFISSPPDLRSLFGPYSPAYNEPLRRARWEKLYEIIRNESHKKASVQGSPRGIHMVHEVGAPVPGITAPAFSLDISLDAKGSIEQVTTEIDLWWTLAVNHDGRADSTELNLRYAGTLVQGYGTLLHSITDLLGLPTAAESALSQFFHQMNGLRLSNLREHDIDVAAIPAGMPLYEFNGRAQFRGRDLTVTLDDSTGFALRRARDLHEASLTYELPLTHFSMGLRGSLNTVYFERRFEH